MIKTTDTLYTQRLPEVPVGEIGDKIEIKELVPSKTIDMRADDGGLLIQFDWLGDSIQSYWFINNEYGLGEHYHTLEPQLRAIYSRGDYDTVLQFLPVYITEAPDGFIEGLSFSKFMVVSPQAMDLILQEADEAAIVPYIVPWETTGITIKGVPIACPPSPYDEEMTTFARSKAKACKSDKRITTPAEFVAHVKSFMAQYCH